MGDVYVCAGVLVYACICVGQRLMWASFFITLHLIFRGSLSWAWSSLVWLNWLASKPVGSACVLLQCWGYRCVHHAWLSHGCWGPNSGPRSYTVNTSPHRTVPHLNFHLYKRMCYSFLKIYFTLNCVICVWVCAHVNAGALEPRREHWLTWRWRQRWSWAAWYGC